MLYVSKPDILGVTETWFRHLAIVNLFIFRVTLCLGKVAMMIVRAAMFAFLLMMNLFQHLKILCQRSLVRWYWSS